METAHRLSPQYQELYDGYDRSLLVKEFPVSGVDYLSILFHWALNFLTIDLIN
jgi:hypothetical protein